MGTGTGKGVERYDHTGQNRTRKEEMKETEQAGQAAGRGEQK